MIIDAATSVRELRRTYLQVLAQRLRSQGDLARHFLGASDQNETLGLAAEKGLREILAQVLPRRFGVTSGFMCEAGGSLVNSPGQGASPQTDVLIYDQLTTSPLFRLDELEVVATRDVMGFIEVKDRDEGEYALRNRGNRSDGALPHIARLAEFAPHAFRAVVLLRDREEERKLKRAVLAARDQCEKQGLKRATVPHALYCARGGYAAVFDYMANELHFLDYGDDWSTSALADFLRVLTSFFAAWGFMTPSVSFGLTLAGASKPRDVPPLRLGPPLASLRDMVLGFEPADDAGPVSEDKLRGFLAAKVRGLYLFPTTGRDHNREFCGGIAVVAELKDAPKSYAASFFVISPLGQLECADPPSSERAAPHSYGAWIIAHERPEAYFQRVGDLRASLLDPLSQHGTRQERPARPQEE